MECPSCGGSDLRAEDQGMLVCQDCGDHFPGYIEEEMDDAFVGTAVSNRASQLAQAMTVRARIAQAEEEEKMKRYMPRKPVPDEEIVFCDAVLRITKGIAKSLVDDGVLPHDIYMPLFQVLAHWVRARHSMVPVGKPGAAASGAAAPGRKVEHHVWAKQFHCAHTLSFISLAAIYIRSPVLPRDLLRRVLQGKTPYFDAASLFLEEDMFAVASVRDALMPEDIPLCRHIDFGILMYGTGEFAWPPLRVYFNGKKDLYEAAAIVSVPLGHVKMSLCRAVRYLGLPDEFGERVLRYIDLRHSAINALREHGAPKPQKNFREKLATKAKGAGSAFTWNPGPAHDCSEWPTDRTLQVDIINVMRICYGHPASSRLKALHSLDSDLENHEKRVSELEEEWAKCVSHMDEWRKTGGGEDATLTSWGTLSMQAVSTLRGKRLERYLRFFKMTHGKSEIPIFLKTHVRSFQSIAASHTRSTPASIQRVQSTGCEWNWSERPSNRRRTFAGVGAAVANSLSSGTEIVNDSLSANQGLLLPKVNTKGKLSNQPRAVRAWNEPVEIALAWTMMRQFFAGTAASAMSDAIRVARRKEFTNIVETADRSLALVLDFINVELGGSHHRQKKRRRSEGVGD